MSVIQSSAPELYWLAATCLLSALLWLPYVVNRFQELGPPGWQWFPAPDPLPRAAWARRTMRAHLNAVENLVVFAPLALGVVIAGLGSPGTAWACRLYFCARVAHYAVCWAGLPIVPRTLCFLAGVAAQLFLAATLLGAG
ncbi:MAPEG family protein [Paucibacter soli]|uniref:MAPEG family protein n=1 Tax=Paucibacter soli TaxID=3133433 RepID=UPI0030A2A56B